LAGAMFRQQAEPRGPGSRKFMCDGV